MIKKRYLILIVLLSFFLISQVSANDNVTQVNYGDLEFKELTPSTPRYTGPTVFYLLEDFFYQGVYDENNENLSEEIILNSTATIGDDSRLNPNLQVSIANRTPDGNATLILRANSTVQGFIVFSFLENQTFDLVNGSLTYDLKNLEKGLYSFDCYYSGDEIFSNATYKNMQFKIPSLFTLLWPEDENIVMYYRNGSRYNITLLDDLNRPLANKTIRLRINSKIYDKITDENGKVSLALNLNPGNYTIDSAFYGLLSLPGCLNKSNITILPTLKADNLVKIYKNDSQFFVSVIDGQGNPLKNQTVQFNINGVFYNRTTDENAVAKLNINLHPGNYIITTENLNDGYKISNNITVLPSVLSKDLVKIYKNDSQFWVQAIDGKGEALSNCTLMMNINGVIYNKTTDSNGKAKLNINLLPGDYIITVVNTNDGCTVSNHIRVTPYLYTDDLVKYYRNASKFEAKLVDSSYNPIPNQVITFEVNGAKYERTTNADGIAALNINLPPGYYYITSSNGEYTVTNLIKVLNTILMPKSYNTFIDWLDETPKEYWGSVHGLDYRVKILDGNGNPYAGQKVTFNVDGSDYEKITNADGIAGFNNIPVDRDRHLVKTYYNGYFVQQEVGMLG